MGSQDKKDAILQSASTAFAEKGFDRTTVSEIAKMAGVGDSTIYEYFQGKEDLLFSIPVEKTRFLVENLEEHLRGIKSVEDKLRKLIWHYLYFQENNRDYANILLFELRANKSFYGSKAYDSFKTYNKILIRILKEGQHEGIFRKNADIHLFRDLIFGSIDHTMYGWLLFEKPKSLVEQVDDLFDLIHSAISAEDFGKFENKEAADSILNKRKAIIKASECIFAEKGFYKSTIADVSQALGIGEATIYEYFQNKEDLLFNIPIERTESLIDALNIKLESKEEAENKLRKFVWHYLSFFNNNKNYVSILLFELRSNRRFYASKSFELFKKFSDILIEILEEGKKEEIFKKDANIYLFRNMVFGSIDHLALRWILFGRPTNLLDQGDELIQFYLRAIKNYST
jgi:AcrR family transcriptional regulator